MTAPQHPEPTEIAVVHEPQRRIQGWLMVLAVVVACASIVFQQWQFGQAQDASTERGKDIKATLQIIRAETSPQAQAAQKEALQSAIDQISCNNRDDLTSLINTLVQKGVLAPGDVDLRRGCTPVSPTTTTTEPRR